MNDKTDLILSISAVASGIIGLVWAFFGLYCLIKGGCG